MNFGGLEQICAARDLGYALGGIIDDHGKVIRAANIAPRQVRQFLDEGNVCIVAGFQGQTQGGEITTLGRG